MNTGSSAAKSREIRLAQRYKFAVKRVMDVVDARTGGDEVIREAVMCEMAAFFAEAKELIANADVNGLEEFYRGVDNLVCQYRSHLRTSNED